MTILRPGDIIGLLIGLAVVVSATIVAHERDMEIGSVLDRMAAVEARVEKVEQKNLPSVNVARGSVYTGDGEVVIQGFNGNREP